MDIGFYKNHVTHSVKMPNYLKQYNLAAKVNECVILYDLKVVHFIGDRKVTTILI